MIVLYLYYNQPQAIAFFEKLGYPNYDIEFLFIDDGSQQRLKDIESWRKWPNAKQIRIEKDIPWNQPYANNLGLKYLSLYSEEELVLRMDIDHYFTKEDFQEIKKIEVGPKEIVFFERIKGSSHPNIYLARVQDLLDAGGYNEAFCGNYGLDDKELNWRLRQKGFKFSKSNFKALINNDAKTRGLKRDDSVNRKKLKKLKRGEPLDE